MRTLRKTMTVVLACLMMALCCGTAAFAKTPSYKTFVVLGLYNPVASESLELGPVEVPYGDLLTQAIKVVNAYMKDGCPYADEYEYVNVMGIETLKSHPGSADYVDDPHPTAKGHRQIANRILRVL